MKLFIGFLVSSILFISCKKEVSNDAGASLTASLSSDALAPLACNATAFSSNHTIVAGQVPPFKFTKTLYASGRVKTINMLSRVYPIHSVYKKHAYELIGTFTYWATPEVRFTGTRETWEYYKTSTGAAARRSIEKKQVTYHFKFNASGYCHSVDNLTPNVSNYSQALRILYDNGESTGIPNAMLDIYVGEAGTPEGPKLFYPKMDEFGNHLSYDLPYNRWASRVSYTYDYAIPRGSKKYNFIPTQNLISQEYSLLEVMGWLPQPSHQRKTVSGIFYPYTTNTHPFNTGERVVQTQTYKNYMFDAKGNQVSLTYADNILQKTTWVCK